MFKMSVIQCLVLLVFAKLSVTSPSLQSESPKSRDVNIAQGPVKGYKDPLGPYIFYDIPYATSPTGKDRFKAVLPPPTWMATFEAVDRFVTCPQAPVLGTRSENCHVASVYVPDTNRTNLPVYVMVHGGALLHGYGNLGTPKAFVQSKEIIAVTFNYRVAVHGFLCLGTKTAPGNAGLKDQVAALRWVKQNIANFGGNPDDITLTGSSAGASSADLLMLSKTVKGIFNKVILDSGSGMAYGATDQKPLERAKEFAQRLNFTNVNNMEALEEFYTTTPLEVLISIDESDFAPCVERNLGEETFLEQSPYEIIKSGDYPKLPLLLGFCDKEGLITVPSFDEYLKLSESMNTEIFNSFPIDLYFETEDERNDVAKRVKELYFGDQPVSLETVEGFIDFQSDIVFIHPILRAIKLHREAGHDQIYLYEYTFPTTNYLPFPGNLTIIGAAHSAQSESVNDEDEDTFSEERKQMKRQMRDLWHNFVITGTPVPSSTSDYPDWPPVNSSRRTPYMILNSNLELRSSFVAMSERIQMWDDIYDKYYRVATPPSSSSSSLLVPSYVHCQNISIILIHILIYARLKNTFAMN